MQHKLTLTDITIYVIPVLKLFCWIILSFLPTQGQGQDIAQNLVAVSSSPVSHKPKIVTSIVPLASIVSMLTGQAAEVTAVNIITDCPHHYHARPSDLTKINKADMVIYIDDQFEVFFSRMINNYQGPKIKISQFSTVNFRNEDNIVNWHFWLDLDNVNALHTELAAILIKTFPALSLEIQHNLIQARHSIADLMKTHSSLVRLKRNMIIIGDSLAHLFKADPSVTYYPSADISLKKFQELQHQLSNGACLIIEKGISDKRYRNLTDQIIFIDSENWQISNFQHTKLQNNKLQNGTASPDLADMFIVKYSEILSNIQQNCK